MSNIFRRPAWVAGALALVLGLSLFIAPVRALASSFLGLFRVQQVQVISYDPAALEQYNTTENNELLNAFFQQNITTKQEGSYTEVATPEEAAALAGFTPRLPKDADVTSLGIQPGETIEINIDSEMMNAGLESFGYPDVKIASELNNQKIVASIPQTITAAFGQCPEDSQNGSDADVMAGCLILMQLPAPTVTAPESFPVVQLGEVVLRILGMSSEQAARYSQSVDWSTTLILPVPLGSNTDTQDITIDGVQGTLVRNPENRQYVLIWIKDGILFGLSGFSDISPAVRLISTLQ